MTSNPTIFQKAMSEGDCVRRPAPRGCSSEEDDLKEIFLAARDHGHRGGLRPAAARSGTRATARTATSRWRSIPNLAYDTSATIEEAQRLHDWVERPNLYVKIPATAAGRRRDRGDDRARPQHQRDADLLARAPPRGRRGVHPRARAARRGGGDLVDGRLRRELLRLARRHRGRPSGSTRPGTPSCKASSPSRTRSSRTRTTRRSSPATAGTRSSRRARRRSGVCWASTSTKNPDVPRRAVRRGSDRPAAR